MGVTFSTHSQSSLPFTTGWASLLSWISPGKRKCKAMTYVFASSTLNTLPKEIIHMTKEHNNPT